MHNRFREHHLFQILQSFDLTTLPLDVFLANYYRAHKALGSKDRKHLSEIIYHLIRWKQKYDFLSHGHPSWEKRYWQYLQKNEASHLPKHIQAGLPKELFEILVRDFDESKALEMGEASNTEAPITIRINPLKTTRDTLISLLAKDLQPTPCKFSEQGIHLAKRINLTELEEFKLGLFEMQDEGSQLIASLVEAKPKEKILDFCAGAGGKTLAFAPSMNNTGVVFLFDIRQKAIDKAKKRLARAGIYNVQFINSIDDIPKVDTVLIDVPCTGTGTYRRNPDLKWKFNQALLEKIKEEQKLIFHQALTFLKPGGKIIYATCSVLKEENERQIEFFSMNYPLKEVKRFSSLPTLNGMDGFFGSVLTYKV